ncbi:MAG: hypothetical protein P1V35_02400 [Planctomycetota bacterium]|nr:hypothetical protein [Planctomycetota bacterium]
MTTRFPFLIAIVFLLSTTARAQMLGEDMDAQWRYPDFATSLEEHVVAVSAGVELPATTILSDTKFEIDLDDDTVEIRFNSSSSWTNTPFNGWFFRDSSDNLPPIVGITIDAFSPGVTNPFQIALDFNENEFWANLGSVTFGSGDWIRFRVEFETNITSFCNPSAANSTGLPASLEGEMDQSGGSGLHLEVTDGPPNEFGYFLVGTEALDPGLPLSDGFLCLALSTGNVIGRYNVNGSAMNSIGQFDAGGVLANLGGTSSTGYGFDVPASLPLPGNPTILVGSTWHFQFWHRDTLSGSGFSNMSNGVSVVF